MLVLTRKHQEKIRIGEDIVVTVLRTKGKTVRLGIEAPSEVPVVRGELIHGSARHITAEQPSANGADTAAVRANADAARTETADDCPDRRLVGVRWTNGAQLHPDKSGEGSGSHTRVNHWRVPRRQIANRVPRLIAGDRPLRAMLPKRPQVS